MSKPINDGSNPQLSDTAIKSAAPRLFQLVTSVRQRLCFLNGIKGACWGLLFAIVAVLSGMWFDLVWELPAGVRAATWVCAAGVFAAALGYLSYQTWRAVEIRRIARRIDAASGTAGQLLNGFELATQLANQRPTNRPDTTAQRQLLSNGLAEIAIERAGQLASRVAPSLVIPWRPALRAVRSLGSVIVAVAVLGAFCPTIAKTQWQRFIHPWDETPPYSPFTITVEPGDTDVVYGKGLEIRVGVEGSPVNEIQLVVDFQGRIEKVPMFPEANGKWRTQLSRLTEDATYFARVDRARSTRYHIHVVTTPGIEDVQFVVTPPAYTHESSTSGPLPKSGLVGLAGTRVQVTARSNRPLSSGEVQWKSEGQIEAVPLRSIHEGDFVVTGEFVISRSAKFELHVKDELGQQSQDPFVGSVTLLTDQPPLVRIVEPKQQSLATPTTMLPIVLDAEDDFGLSRVELYRSLNNSRPIPINVPVSDPPPRRFRDQQFLPLTRYELQPGDEIKLFARVEDNDPAGAKGAESSVVMVRIISQSEFDRMLRVREGLNVLVSKYQQAERRMESLAEEIAKLQKDLENAPPDSPLAEEMRKRIEKLSEDLQKEADVILQAADHDLPYDLDQKLKQQLKDVANELKSHADELQTLTKRESSGISSAAAQQRLKKMAEKLAEKKKTLNEEANEPLDLLAKIYPLMEDEARFTALVMWQVDLAERLAAYKGIEQSNEPPVKARMRDLQEEQRKIRDELARLLDDIDNHTRQLPDDEAFDNLRRTATEFLAKARACGAAQEMSQAEAELTDFRGDAAHGHALEAAEMLKKLLSQCNGMSQQCKGCLSFNPKLSSSLGNTIEQLLAEAGLSMGKGNGVGSGAGRGGYSMRSANRNVGLYGQTSLMGGQANASRGFGPSGQGASGRGEQGDFATESLSTSAAWRRSSSIANTNPLPHQYRRRINQYFERVAKELEAAGQ